MDIVGLKCLNEINRNLLLVTHAVVLLYIRRSSVPVKCLAHPGYRHGTCRWYRWRWRRGFGGSAMLVQILLCIFVFYWHCLRTAMCHQCYQRVFQRFALPRTSWTWTRSLDLEGRSRRQSQHWSLWSFSMLLLGESVWNAYICRVLSWYFQSVQTVSI